MLAHDPEDAIGRTPLTPPEGLDHFAAEAERALRRGECEALMSHYVLVTRQRVKRAGGQLYVWTVDDAAKIARLEALGVDAVITNDPRLFG